MYKNIKTITTIAAIIVSLTLLVQITIIDTSYALTRYYNCITRNANNHGELSLEKAMDCYDLVFKGAQGTDEFGKPLK